MIFGPHARDNIGSGQHIADRTNTLPGTPNIPPRLDRLAGLGRLEIHHRLVAGRQMVRIEAGIEHALAEIIARNPREIGGIQNIRGIARGDHLLIYQYGNEANPRAHYEGTAKEILDELDDVTAFVGGLGTGGTLMGNGRRLKEHDPETKIVAAEPMQGELVQGLRSLDDGFIPPIIDLSLLDRKIMVSNRDAILWTRKLLHDEGMFAGVSSGAIAYVANRIANELDEGNVVFLVPDDGWKYLSSGIYTKPLEELEDIDSTVWW